MEWIDKNYYGSVKYRSSLTISYPVQSSPVQSSPVYFSWQSLLSTKDEWDLETKLLCFEEFYTEHGIEGNAFLRQKKFFSWLQYYLVTIQDLKRLSVSAIMDPRSWNWRVFEFSLPLIRWSLRMPGQACFNLASLRDIKLYKLLQFTWQTWVEYELAVITSLR